MLLRVEKFGGILPRVLDPSLLPENRSQVATNCRFDRGGVLPLPEDTEHNHVGTGTIEALYLYYESGVPYLFKFDAYTSITPAPLGNDAYNRVFFVSSGALVVTDRHLFSRGGTNYPMEHYITSPPAPTNAPEVLANSSGSDPTLLETRGYVYTYVNGYGQEGPPSPVSNLVSLYDGNPVTIYMVDLGLSSLYWIKTKRIYRLNQTLSGAQYQFVAEITLETDSYVEQVASASLGEVLASALWDGPPTGIENLIALPNGVLAGSVGKYVCFSEPYYPHAWPANYQKVTEADVVGLGAFGTNVFVGTKGQPYLIIGNHPENMVMEKVESGQACLSGRGTVDFGNFVIYPCPEGLAAVGPGDSDVLTKDFIAPNEWRDTYQPSTIRGYYWQGKYVGFYASSAGFIFDPVTKDFTPLDFYATAGYHDKIEGVLYLRVGAYVVRFGASTSINRLMTYKTKRFRFSLGTLGVVRVLATQFPVTLDITFPGVPITITKRITSSDPVRISTDHGLVDSCEVQVSGAQGVSAIFLASTLEEIPL